MAKPYKEAPKIELAKPSKDMQEERMTEPCMEDQEEIKDKSKEEQKVHAE